MTGPEVISRSVGSAGTIPIDLTGVTWDVTLRRRADLSILPSVAVVVSELDGERQGHTTTDASGRFPMTVRPGKAHQVQVYYAAMEQGPFVAAESLATSTDSTFDLVFDGPAPIQIGPAGPLDLSPTSTDHEVGAR